MATLYVLGRRGDERVHWTHEQLLANDPETIAAVTEAERIFAAERARGSQAFRVVRGQPAEPVEAFDPAADEIVIVPRMVGGC